MSLAILISRERNSPRSIDRHIDQEIATDGGIMMIGENVGKISVNEKTPNSRLQRYVQERIKLWLSSQDLEKVGPSDYEVAFFDEDVAGEVSCLITVQAGETQWRSWETGENPQAALNRSLENMHIDMKH